MIKKFTFHILCAFVLIGSWSCASAVKQTSINSANSKTTAESNVNKSETEAKIDQRLDEIREENYGKFRINSLFKK